MIEIRVIFPNNRPLFGLKDELHIRIGFDVELNSDGVDQVFITSSPVSERIGEGLRVFKDKYPGTKVIVSDDERHS